MKTAIALGAALAATISPTTLTGDKAQVIEAAQVHAHLAQLSAQAVDKGSSGSTLASYGNLALKLSVRTTSGEAEIHAHFDDLMIVEQGNATLITGGTVIDARSAEGGEVTGKGILGGVSRAVAQGDVIVVPAGVPHQLVIPHGVTYSAMVAKIREP